MRKIVVIVAVLAVVTLGGIFFNQRSSIIGGKRSPEIASLFTGENLHKATLSIKGMWCSSCAVGAQYSLKSIEGVADAYVGFTENLDGEGWVVYDPDKVTEEQIVKAVEPYKATIVSDKVYNQ